MSCDNKSSESRDISKELMPQLPSPATELRTRIWRKFEAQYCWHGLLLSDDLSSLHPGDEILRIQFKSDSGTRKGKRVQDRQIRWTDLSSIVLRTSSFIIQQGSSPVHAAVGTISSILQNRNGRKAQGKTSSAPSAFCFGSTGSLPSE